MFTEGSGGPSAARRDALAQKIGRMATKGIRDAAQGVEAEAAAPLKDALHLPVIDLGRLGKLTSGKTRLREPYSDRRPDASLDLVAGSHADRIIGPVGDGLQVRASKP